MDKRKKNKLERMKGERQKGGKKEEEAVEEIHEAAL